ncbi:MAG: DNA polymerase III subunit chi, partial [Gemmatimonadetes bacterium]|nr:DNA polymerase III subunit chi [Gemmatimonadota bacterium]
LISGGGATPADAEVLINLCEHVPEGFERFARIVEPVDGDAARRKAGRERYRFYRERGLAPDTHTVQRGHEP